MANTTNYNLIKPDATDFYDVGDFNDNADIIDTTMKSISNIANAKTNKAVTGTITLSSSNWTALSPVVGEYNYKYEYTLSGITANDIFNGSVTLATEEAAQDCGLAQYTETSANKVKFYAKDAPAANIAINYNYIQGV